MQQLKFVLMFIVIAASVTSWFVFDKRAMYLVIGSIAVFGSILLAAWAKKPYFRFVSFVAGVNMVAQIVFIERLHGG